MTIMDPADLKGYYEYVACTRRVLGPARSWSPTAVPDGLGGVVSGRLAVHHRYHGFSIDAWLTSFRGEPACRPGGGVPLLHGMKGDSMCFVSADGWDVSFRPSAAEPWRFGEPNLWVRCITQPAACEYRLGNGTTGSARGSPGRPLMSVSEHAAIVADFEEHPIAGPWEVIPRVAIAGCLRRSFACAPLGPHETPPPWFADGAGQARGPTGREAWQRHLELDARKGAAQLDPLSANSPLWRPAALSLAVTLAILLLAQRRRRRWRVCV